MEHPPFGALLKRYRAAAALPQRVLAEQAGLSLDAISALETGRRGCPRLDTARRLADALGLRGEDRTQFLAAAQSGAPSASNMMTTPSLHTERTSLLRPLGTPLPVLPRQTGPLLGREREVSALGQLVRQTALLTLVGPGGVGKTRLALHVAGAVTDAFADGVVFVSLASLSDPALVGPTIAEALGITDGDTRPLLTVLKDVLQPRCLLLVLDNFEHVGEAAPLIADLLAACPRLSLLVTSRAPLHVTGEQEFTVSPLAIPTLSEVETPHVATLQNVPSVALFMARARLVDVNFALSPANAGAVAAICRRLDGLPLALELAAARVKILPPVALLARLEQRLHVLTGGPRDLPARQQTLRQTVAWSYDLLGAAEKSLLARLSVFVGGCSLAAVTAICGPEMDGDPLEGVASLVDKNLLHDSLAHAGEDDPRFVMLQTVHEFAHEQLAARAEVDAMSRRHARYFTAFAEEATDHMDRGVGLEWCVRMDRDKENIRAALDWSAGQAETGESEAMDLALRLGIAVWYAINCGGVGAGAWMRQKLLGILSHAPAATSPHVRMQALSGAARLAETAGLVTQADTLYQETLALARATGDPALAVGPLIRLALVRTDPTQRRAELDEALALARVTVSDNPADDASNVWGVQIYLAIHHLDVGELPRGRALVEEVLAHSMAQGDLHAASMALDVLAHIERAEGQTETARQLFAESLTLRRLLGDGHALGHILRFLGEIAEEQGKTEQATSYYAEALALLRDACDVNRSAAVLRGVAALALRAGDATRALRIAGAVHVVHATYGTRISMDVAPAQNLWARTSWEHIRSAAQHALNPLDAAAAWAEGQAMSLEQVIAVALDWMAPPHA